MEMATICGGTQHYQVRAGMPTAATLTPTERLAALSALNKLGQAYGATSGISSVLGGGLSSATLSGGTVSLDKIQSIGSDTFAGGVGSGLSASINAIGSDTVVAGSAFAKGELSSTASSKSGTLNLSGDTINIAGVTAASVKTETPVVKAGIKITMPDKTSITLTGISTHDLKH
jgi:hypothetical protein